MEFHGVSIDSEHARILDDALWISRNGDGWTVRVAITDVPSAIARGGPDDLIARQVGFTRIDCYGYPVRLFQTSLQRECLSLRPDSGQPVVCVSLEVSASLKVTDIEIDRATLGQLLPISFTGADTFLLPDSDPALHGFMTAANDLASALARARSARAMSDPVGWTISPWASGVPGVPDMTGETASCVVNEIMVLANGAIAEFCLSEGIPLLWRVQPATDTGHYARSHLATEAMFHSGLEMPSYARFTSPIRRYEDVVNLRNLMAYLENDTMPHGLEEIALMALYFNSLADEMAEAAREERWATTRAAAAKEEEERLSALSLDCQLDHAEDTGILRPSLVTLLMARLTKKNVESGLKARLLCSSIPAMPDLKIQVLESLAGNMRQASAVLAACAAGMDVEPAVILHAASQDGEVSAVATMMFRGQRTVGGPEYAATRTEANRKARISLLAAISGTGWLSPGKLSEKSSP